MGEPCHSALFEEAIQVSRIDSHTYSAYLDPVWCIGSVPHGGYTTSVLYRLATVHCRKNNDGKGPWRASSEPVAFQLSFLRRTLAGHAILKVQDMKVGLRTSVIHVALLQPSDHANSRVTKSNAGDRDEILEVKLVAYITVSPPTFEESTPFRGPWELHPPPAPGSLPNGSIDFDSLAQNGVDGAWAKYHDQPLILSAARQLEVYEPTVPPAATIADLASRTIDQWSRFTPGGKVARWSNESVLFLIDMFPPAFDRLEAMERRRMLAAAEEACEADVAKKQFWFASVAMNIDLRTRIPHEGVEWLHTRVVSRMVRGSRADLDVMVLDQSGQAIALGTQISLVVDQGRNTKGRTSTEKL
ncbi:thioesterase-like superfamily-domain-containing protein [Aspergillus granulosus]|uniref:Thioesterase-like superfamily-domain-containing protein n=1 Tax=Aspergillus granulosus TaxID=176169 RepID=A0ABR4HYS6_9EURO